MKFNSQICTTKEQSERLLALGLKKETADMSITTMPVDGVYKGVKYSLTPYSEIRYPSVFGVIPAWSLHRLLCLLPTEYTYDIDFQQIMQDFVFGSQDMYDEMASCIETLIEAGYFYEEYLE